jgi:hypothetical protein
MTTSGGWKPGSFEDPQPRRCPKCSEHYGAPIMHAARDRCPLDEIERWYGRLIAAIRRSHHPETVTALGVLARLTEQPVDAVRAEAERRLIDFYYDRLGRALHEGFEVAQVDALRWLRRFTGLPDEDLRAEARKRWAAREPEPSGPRWFEGFRPWRRSRRRR